jgi:hypothetical protein
MSSDFSDNLSRVIKEVAAHPEGPLALNLMSSVNAALRPREKAWEAAVVAQADALDAPGDDALAAAAGRSLSQWELVRGQALDAHDREDLAKAARDLLDKRRRAPPRIGSILADWKEAPDYGYELAGTLDGVRGIWHRLWGSLVLEYSMGEGVQVDGQPLSTVLLADFEGKAGRKLSQDEWAALQAHALRRAQSLDAAR